MKELVIGDLKAKFPIIQGGMGVGISLSNLAAAVANQGGVGVIAVAGIGISEKDLSSNYLKANLRALRREIHKAKEMTSGILGVNIMVALSDFIALAKTAIEEKIDIIFAGAGLPLTLPELLTKDANTKLVPIISSAKAARILIRRWHDKYDYVPDAFVVEGPKAGGHLGFKKEQLDDPAYQLENLVTEVIDEIRPFESKFNKKIPVIAGGGIYTGEDIYKIMQLGADAVQMATRFVTTEECDASTDFKNTYIDAKKEDIGIIQSPVGMPGRAIINDFINEANSGNKVPYKCPYHCIATCEYKDSPYCIAVALVNAKKGLLKHGFAFAGVNAYHATEILPIENVFKDIQEEYERAEKTNSD